MKCLKTTRNHDKKKNLFVLKKHQLKVSVVADKTLSRLDESAAEYENEYGDWENDVDSHSRNALGVE